MDPLRRRTHHPQLPHNRAVIVVLQAQPESAFGDVGLDSGGIGLVRAVNVAPGDAGDETRRLQEEGDVQELLGLGDRRQA